MLRLFLGEGDQYSDWEDLPLADIQWVQMAAPLEFGDEHGVLNFIAKHRKLRRSLDADQLL